MSLTKSKISPREHGAVVELDPNFLLTHATYMPDGETIHRSHMTVGQMIEAIAYAYINSRAPQLKGKCKVVRIEFVDGKFTVRFADHVDHLE